MHYLEGISIIDYHRRLREVTGTETAWKIIREFYAFFEAEGAGEMLWYLLTVALISDNEEITSKHRSNLLFFYEYSRALHQAVYLLNEERQTKKKRKKKNNHKNKR
jgi:hypothetical protein